jgi:cobalt-zinc-cadmium efflux system protein
MGLHGVPASVDGHAVGHYLAELPGVSAVHDLHIWPMSTTETAMTAHLVIPTGHPGDQFLTCLAHTLEHRFSICHSTVQIETSDHAGHVCAPACQPRAQVA